MGVNDLHTTPRPKRTKYRAFGSFVTHPDHVRKVLVAPFTNLVFWMFWVHGGLVYGNTEAGLVVTTMWVVFRAPRMLDERFVWSFRWDKWKDLGWDLFVRW